MNSNPTIDALQSHIGQLFVTNWEFYLYDKMKYVDMRSIVSLLDIEDANKYYEVSARRRRSRGLVTVKEACARPPAPRPTRKTAGAAAFLLFPDGIKRWTFVWQDVPGYDDCLKLLAESSQTS